MLINIDVDDIERGVAFYTRAFGLVVGRRFDAAFVELLGLPAPIYLLEKQRNTLPFAGAGAPRNYERHWTPVHIDITVPNLAEAHAQAVAAGARVESGVVEEPYGLMTFFSDPFGHGFCFIEWRGRGYDELL